LRFQGWIIATTGVIVYAMHTTRRARAIPEPEMTMPTQPRRSGSRA